MYSLVLMDPCSSAGRLDDASASPAAPGNIVAVLTASLAPFKLKYKDVFIFYRGGVCPGLGRSQTAG